MATPRPDPAADTERALLGAILAHDGDAHKLLLAASEVLTGESFGAAAHRLIWDALQRLDVDERPLDLVSLRSELASAGSLEAAGGVSAIASLVDGVPVVGEAAVVSWARQVAEAGRLRQITAELVALAHQAQAGTATVEELLSGAERVATGAQPAKSAVLDRATVASATWAAVEQEIRGERHGIPTGFGDLDTRLRFGGWRPGQLVYVGARTSRGKSALLLGLAEAAAQRHFGVLFVPLEMSAEEMGTRRLVAHAGVSLAHLDAWRQSERDKTMAALREARPILDRPLDYTESSVRSLAQIRAASRRHKQRHGLDVLVVDYLGLIQHESKGSLYERTTLTSQGLKALAMSLGVVVLCAVQLNRETASKDRGKSTRPTLACFRDSGAIEQDCDIALLIHQESTVDAIQEGDCELIIAKQRNGWTGTVPMTWRAACARFESRQDWSGEAA